MGPILNLKKQGFKPVQLPDKILYLLHHCLAVDYAADVAALENFHQNMLTHRQRLRKVLLLPPLQNLDEKKVKFKTTYFTMITVGI